MDYPLKLLSQFYIYRCMCVRVHVCVYWSPSELYYFRL